MIDPPAIDRHVRDRLADSLAHIADRAGARLGIEPARADAAIAAVGAHRQDPGVFAAYFDAAHALFAQDDDTARAAFTGLLDRALTPCTFAVVAYDRELGADHERFPRLVFAEFASSNPMAAPTPARLAGARQTIGEALDVIASVDPGVRAEIDALLVRVFVAGLAPDARPFGGGTSLTTWGATFFNADGHQSLWSTTEFLVHEVTHAVLLGRSVSDPLVRNPITESYPSPLRADRRPMDGIYHATLVCGRLLAFERAWLDRGDLDGEDRALCEQALARHAERYDAGVETIDRDGQLSEQGAALLDDSRVLVAAAR